jgi:hypothetical protein
MSNKGNNKITELRIRSVVIPFPCDKVSEKEMFINYIV